MNYIRKFLTKWFGFEWCILVDFDGEINIRRIHKIGEHMFAKRVGFGIRNVWLSPNGEVKPRCYVTRWEHLKF